jgi:hypothetical protein
MSCSAMLCHTVNAWPKGWVRQIGACRMGQDSGSTPDFHVPRLLAFYQDLWDDDGTALGWKPIAWGLRFADGSAISVPVEGRPAVTLWQSLEDATEALDAYVDTPEPRTHLDPPKPPPPPPPAPIDDV